MSKDSHSFSVSVAQQVGVPRAILIQHLAFLQKSNVSGDENWQEKWVRRTAKSMAKTYPYWTPKQISTICDSLEKDEYVFSKIENALKTDRAKSFLLTTKGLLLIGETPFAQMENGVSETSNASDKTENDISPNGEMNIEEDCTSFVPSFERGQNEKNSPPHTELSPVEAKKNVEGNSCAGAGPTLVEIHDAAHPDIPVFDVVPPAPVTHPPAHRIELGDRPNAETPVQLEAALRDFYTSWPNEWSVGILENGRGRKYDAPKQVEIVKDFCCWAVDHNRQRDTFGQLNARLQAWFRNEQHSTWKQAKPGQPGNTEKPVYERPKNAIY